MSRGEPVAGIESVVQRQSLGHQSERPLDALRPHSDACSETHSEASGRERRAYAREHVDAAAFIVLVKSGQRLQGRVMDLSLGGCRIHLLDPYPLGIYTRAEVEFSLEGLSLRLGGVIQSIHQKCSVGFRFLDVSERKRLQLTNLIAEIQAMRQVAAEALANAADSL